MQVSVTLTPQALEDNDVRPQAPARPSLCPAGFKLFLLLTAVLVMRPSELVPALAGVPFYELIIVVCFAASLPAILVRMSWRSLKTQPGALCVLGLLPAIVISGLAQPNLYMARTAGLEFAKLLIYFVLFICLVDSARRLEIFLNTLAVLVAIVAALTLLTYYQVLAIESLAPVVEGFIGGEDSIETPTAVPILRLRAAGIFNDPNDFSLVLVVGLVVAIRGLFTGRRFLPRLGWLITMVPSAWALQLTHSRGGFLAFVSSVGIMTVARLGWKKALPLGLLAAPVLLLFFGGRQTDIDLTDKENTAVGRIGLWRDSLVLFHSAPIFGIGPGQLEERNELVAHNSYVHAFAELGIIGGTLFVGIFFVPFQLLFRVIKATKPPRPIKKKRGDFSPPAPPPRPVPVLSRAVAHWAPFALAILTSYAVGLFSLSRVYTVSTYMVMGVAVAYCNLVTTQTPRLALPLGWKLVFHVGRAAFIVLVLLHAIVKIAA